MKVVKGKIKKGKIKLDKAIDMEDGVEVIVIFPEKKKNETDEVEFEFESEAFKDAESANKQEQSQRQNFNFQDFLKDDRVRNITDILKKAGWELSSELKKKKR